MAWPAPDPPLPRIGAGQATELIRPIPFEGRLGNAVTITFEPQTKIMKVISAGANGILENGSVVEVLLDNK